MSFDMLFSIAIFVSAVKKTKIGGSSGGGRSLCPSCCGLVDFAELERSPGRHAPAFAQSATWHHSVVARPRRRLFGAGHEATDHSPRHPALRLGRGDPLFGHSRGGLRARPRSGADRARADRAGGRRSVAMRALARPWLRRILHQARETGDEVGRGSHGRNADIAGHADAFGEMAIRARAHSRRSRRNRVRLPAYAFGPQPH
jgi:hypothetical protein